MDTTKTDNGFTAVTIDTSLQAEMDRDIQTELAKTPARKKIPYREMIATYRQAWLEHQNIG